MNRRQKIIVSVTGIFLVLLLLVGLTYAYFLTQITGNINTKSISVSTANLALVYGDGNGFIEPTEKLLPGTTVDSKTFTVSNEGNATIDSYAVVLENFKVTYATNSGDEVAGASTSLAYPSDMKLTIKCTSDVSNKTCNGLDGTLPTTNDILLTNTIDVGETQSYELVLEYLETGTNQSEDMNKTIEGKINIIDTNSTVDLSGTVTNYAEGDYVQTNSVQRISPIDKDGKYKVIGLEPGSHTIRVYSSTGTEKGSQTFEIVKGEKTGVSGNTITINDLSRTFNIDIDATAKTYTIGSSIEETFKNPFASGTLAYSILNNAVNASCETSTIYSPTPLTTPAVEVSGENERTLSVTPDNLGNSYYFRGNVEDNYLNFAGMCWRIIRIEGDGAIKIVLADSTAECSTATQTKTDSAFIGQGSFGPRPVFIDDESFEEGVQNSLNIWLNSNSINKNLIKTTNICIGNSTVYNYRSEEIVDVGLFEYWDYSTRDRLNKGLPSLKCNSDSLSKKTHQIYLLTADEVVFAGGRENANNYAYYLRNNATTGTWWTLSNSRVEGNNAYEDYFYAYAVDNGKLHDTAAESFGNSPTEYENYIRPAISLISGITITNGDGTIDNPYIVG